MPTMKRRDHGYAAAAGHSFLFFGCLLLCYCCFHSSAFVTGSRGVVTTRRSTLPPQRNAQARLTVLSAAALSDREKEIRRKIAKFKKEGRLQKKQGTDDWTDDGDEEAEKTSTQSEYQSKIQQKLGKAKSKMLGFSSDSDAAGVDVDDEEEEDVSTTAPAERQAQIGALPVQPDAKNDDDGETTVPATQRQPLIDPTLFQDDDEVDESQLSDEELVDLVAQKMTEKRQREQREKENRIKLEARERLEQLEAERKEQAEQNEQKFKTTGVGGSWKENTTATTEMYQPKSGSWGAFPRPKDISKAYGGGRRIGPGYSKEKSAGGSGSDTRDLLKRYREKVGIDVQSEKDHAKEIDEAVNIATRAMQRGVYQTAVSALEKVTKYCSTNSKVGSKVFLELAMAYEAVGRTTEAITVYQTLSNCRIEEIKHNAKRLLYGIEAMQFMRNDVGSAEFSRRAARNTFIDTTGLGDIASKFDDVYETAYIDLDSGFYKRLTESVVRGSREARQILLRAVGPGEVDRLRIVQALRSLSRAFDDALQTEMSRNAPIPEPVAVMDGQPIVAKEQDLSSSTTSSSLPDMEEFVLTDAAQMMENLNGEWRLQLLADKRGDGVNFFNSTTAWQRIDADKMTFEGVGPAGFVTLQLSGKVEFNDKRRILRRAKVQVSGGGVLGGLFGKTAQGAAGAVSTPCQVMSVDSILLVTRLVPSKLTSNKDNEKDHFAVWRRVEPGTFSEQQT